MVNLTFYDLRQVILAWFFCWGSISQDSAWSVPAKSTQYLHLYNL